MKKLLEFIATNIVVHPKEVVISQSVDKDQTNFTVSCHPEDIKIIIGKKGRTIKSIREILAIIARKENHKVTVVIEDLTKK